MCSDTLSLGGEVRGCSMGCMLGMSDVSPFVFIEAATRYMGFLELLCRYSLLRAFKKTQNEKQSVVTLSLIHI